MQKTFIYCGGNTMDNVGNGFLDIGALYQLRTVCPDANIISISNTSPEKEYYFGGRFGLRGLGGRRPGKFDLRRSFEGDFFVFTAACLCDFWFSVNHDFLAWLAEEKKRVVILGASGSDSGSLRYNKGEFNRIKNEVSKLNLFLMSSRDNATYEAFGDIATYAYNGIDCAFYLSEAFTPTQMNRAPYDVIAVDDNSIPEIQSERETIRVCHKASRINSLTRAIRHPIRDFGLMHKLDWVSDSPMDYLQIYANCNTVYADRVHACVAALTYGRKAQYLGNSPRYGLLSRVLGDQDVRSHPVQLDLVALAEEKAAQLKFLTEHLNDGFDQ